MWMWIMDVDYGLSLVYRFRERMRPHTASVGRIQHIQDMLSKILAEEPAAEAKVAAEAAAEAKAAAEAVAAAAATAANSSLL